SNTTTSSRSHAYARWSSASTRTFHAGALVVGGLTVMTSTRASLHLLRAGHARKSSCDDALGETFVSSRQRARRRCGPAPRGAGGGLQMRHEISTPVRVHLLGILACMLALPGCGSDGSASSDDAAATDGM